MKPPRGSLRRSPHRTNVLPGLCPLLGPQPVPLSRIHSALGTSSHLSCLGHMVPFSQWSALCPSFVSWGGPPPPRPLSAAPPVSFLVCLFVGCGGESWLPPQCSPFPFLWCHNAGFSRSMANQNKVSTSHPPLHLGVAPGPSSPRRWKGKAFPFLLLPQVQSFWGTLRVEATH